MGSGGWGGRNSMNRTDLISADSRWSMHSYAPAYSRLSGIKTESLDREGSGGRVVGRRDGEGRNLI